MGWTYRIFGLVCTIHLNLVSLKSPIPVVYKKKENTEGVFWIFSGLCTIVPSFSVIRIFCSSPSVYMNIIAYYLP
jgi:hypothetical protein